jgi:hypothetical protein
MATEAERDKRLYDFLRASFRLADFERFLTFQGGGIADVAQAVNTNVGASGYFFEVVQELRRKGLMGLIPKSGDSECIVS